MIYVTADPTTTFNLRPTSTYPANVSEMKDYEANVKFHYPISTACNQSSRLGRYLELFIERCQPKRIDTLMFSNGYASFYTSPLSKISYTRFRPSMHTHASLNTLSRHLRVIKMYVSTNGATTKAESITCRFLSKEAAID